MSPEVPLSIGVLVGSVSRNAGGLFNSVRRSAIGLQRAGCDVTVYGLDDEHTEEDLAEWAPIVPRVFRRQGPRRLGYGPGLSAALAQGDHDVVHLHGLWQALSIQATTWRKAAGRPVMLSPRGMLDPWALQNGGLKKRIAARMFERENLTGAACLHALNRSEAQSMRDFGLDNPIAVIPNGADMPERLDWPAPVWMTADRRRTLLYLGRLHPKKGLSGLLRAWAKLKAEAPKTIAGWRLAVAGWDDGGHLAELRRMVIALDLKSEVIFPGPLFGDDKARAFANAGAVVLPSFSEGLPMAVLEAWAYGRAVFMTQACNLPEGFAAGAAVAIDTDPAQMASTLEHGLARLDLDAMGQRGRELVTERFTWSSIARAHAQVYRWMRHGGERPSCVSSPEFARRVA